MTPDVRVYANTGELCLGAAVAAVAVIDNAIRAAGRCSLVLSGGSTPAPFYRLLATEFRDQIAWPSVHIFWGDERYVSPDHPDSNYRLARETLLDHVPCPAANIHPMPTHWASPDAAAADYERTLKNDFAAAWPRFDLALLGMGEDGHTASLFPGAPALSERERWVTAVAASANRSARLTLTLPALTHATTIYVLVAGASKADALHGVLTGEADASTYPAAGLHRTEGTVIWWCDRDAAARL